ncbi:MAG: thioesterase family protein [Oscillospiraceae bacterium]
MLSLGMKNEVARAVDGTNTAKAMGSGALDVFATPAMVALMEYTAYKSVEPFLEENQGTVGAMIEARHLSATPVGMAVVCKSELIEIERTRLRFEIEVSDSAGVVGTAVHDRFIIDNDRFMEKCLQKLK